MALSDNTEKSDNRFPDLYEASIAELRAGLDGGHFTSVDLVKAYFARIEEVNVNGPGLRAVVECNPSALRQAAELDEERAKGGKRSKLHGIPVLLKDNIATDISEGMNTTAGSYALLGSIPPGDAGVVKRLRKAGAILLGKANLSEFSYFRGQGGELPSGWSGRGGQATNAYYPNGDPCGSSSGSGVAASIGLTAVALGTETDGSIICPSNKNNVVGIKPTVGLTSRAGVIPITSVQDSVGPMTRCVADAATVLSVIAGSDENDGATSSLPEPVPDFTLALDSNAFKGKRIGVPRQVYMDVRITKVDPSVITAFEEALNTMRGLGAEIVDPADLPSAVEMNDSKQEAFVLEVDFKVEINAYLASLKDIPTGVRTLTDIIKFNNEHPDLEKPSEFEGQGRMISAEATQGRDAKYHAAVAYDRDIGGTRGIDAALKAHKLDALVLPSPGPSCTPAAITGYPVISVPLGFYPDSMPVKPNERNPSFPADRAPGMPFGICFFGTAYSEFTLIGLAYAFEQATQARRARRAYAAAIPKTQLQDIISKN